MKVFLYKHPAGKGGLCNRCPQMKRVVEEVKVFIVLNPEYEEKITEENIIEWAKKRNGCIQISRITEFV